MSILEELKKKYHNFKEEQNRRREFKKELDFEKYKAMEIAKAKREIKDIKEGKKSTKITDKDLLGYDPSDLKLGYEELK